MKNSVKLSIKAFLPLLFLFINVNFVNTRGVSKQQIINETFLQEKVDISDNISYDESTKDLKLIINDIINSNSKLLKNTNFSIGVYFPKSKKVLFGKDFSTPLTPASTTKLFTTYNALSNQLQTINTSVYTDGEIKSDGTLKGSLYLYGRGDALLNTSDIESIASMIFSKGIRKITGNIVADNSFFDGITNRMKYSGDNEEVQGLAPITALSVNKNTVTINVNASSIANSILDVNIEPNSDGIDANVTATVKVIKAKSKKSYLNKSLVNKKSKKSKNQNLGDESDSKPLDVSNIKIGSSVNTNGKQTFNISGYLSPKKHGTYYANIKNPDLVAAGLLKKQLSKKGIVISGQLLRGRLNSNFKANDKNTIAEFKRPIYDLVKVVNKFSDNYIAEHLFKFNGAAFGFCENNASGACKLLNKMTDSLCIPFKNCQLNDGSGLSRRNKLTTESEIKLLEVALKNKSLKFDSTLSIAGYDGTLRHRLIGTKAQNNLHAKTGTLKNVSALSGYVNSLDGETLIFSFIFNGPNVGSYKQIENKIGEALANYTFKRKNT